MSDDDKEGTENQKQARDESSRIPDLGELLCEVGLSCVEIIETVLPDAQERERLRRDFWRFGERLGSVVAEFARRRQAEAEHPPRKPTRINIDD